MEEKTAKPTTKAVVAQPEGKALQQNSPSTLIEAAIAKGGVDLDKLEKVLELQIKWEQNEAKKAYVVAMTAFKENPPKVFKDKKNKQYDSMYVTLGNLVNTVNPELSKHGLSGSWDIEQNGFIKVTCKITHCLGHSESTFASAPKDESGAKNIIQQIKSTITYLKAVTFECILGLASTDANVDDDGAGSQEIKYITDKQLHTLRDLMLAKEADEAKFCAYLKVESFETLRADAYDKAISALNAKKKKVDANSNK